MQPSRPPDAPTIEESSSTPELVRVFPAPPDVVAYHAHCTDGLCAAAVVFAAINDLVAAGVYEFGTGLIPFVPVSYNRPLPDQVLAGGNSLLILDWCPDREQLENLRARFKRVFVVDHHESHAWIRHEFPGSSYFRTDKSGAALAWDFCFDGEAPPLVAHVQDRDLWQWQLRDSRAVSAYLRTWPADVELWSRRLHGFDATAAAKSGKLLLEQVDVICRLQAKNVMFAEADGQKVAVVNATAELSQTCELLLEQHPDCSVALAWFQRNTQQVQLSFRSRPGSGAALELAERFAGGGHPAAAGATLQVPCQVLFRLMEGMAS